MSFGRAFRLVAVGLGGLAVVMVLVCVVNVVRTRTFLAESVTATGQVVELVTRQSCHAREDDEDEQVCSPVYAPRIVFTAADGREVDFVSSIAENPPAYTEGDVVDVRYRPARPAQAQIDSVGDLWFGAIVTGAIALVFLALTGLWVVLAVKFRKE